MATLFSLNKKGFLPRSSRMFLAVALFSGFALPSYAAQAVPTGNVSDAPIEKPDRKKVFDAESFTLDNGMQVVVIPNHRAPVVTHMVWYKVGAADEEYGHSGIAHFLEHLMFKGSSVLSGESLEPGEFSKIIRGMGGNDNAFTSQDYTAYFQSVPADKLETVMHMEAGRMNGMAPPLEEVLAERNVVLEERRQRVDNNPNAQFQEQLSAHAYVNHPYAIPVLGWAKEMAAMEWPAIKAFYDRHYAPNNAILVVSGDVTPGAVFQLAIDTYGTLPREDVPERVRPSSPPMKAQAIIEMNHPQVQEPVVQTLYRVPSARLNKNDALALQVLEEIMDGGSSARLYKSIVSEQKIATSIGLSYSTSAWDDASLWLYGVPTPDHTLEDVQAALENELRLLIQKGVSEEELNEAKTSLIDQADYARDSLTGPAMVIGQSLVTGSTLDDVEYWPYDIETITNKDVQMVAFKYLNPDRASITPPVTGYLWPEKTEAAPDTIEEGQ